MRSCTLTLQYGTMTIDAEGFVVSPTRYELNMLNLWGVTRALCLSHLFHRARWTQSPPCRNAEGVQRVCGASRHANEGTL